MVASIRVSKTPSFQRLLAWPIENSELFSSQFAPGLSQPEQRVVRGRRTAAEIALDAGLERAPACQRPSVHADPAKARRHAEIAALHGGGTVVQRDRLRRRRISLVTGVQIGPAGELREPVEAHLGVGARNANGQARQIGPQRILVRELIAHRLRRQQPRYGGFEGDVAGSGLCRGRLPQVQAPRQGRRTQTARRNRVPFRLLLSWRRGVTRSSDLCSDRLLLAFQFVDPVLQRIDLPHQVFDRGLLRHSRASHHRCCQDTDDEGLEICTFHLRSVWQITRAVLCVLSASRNSETRYARITRHV